MPFRRNGAMVLCFDESERPGLQALYDRGVRNGVEGMRILTGEEARAMEPNLSDAVCAALYCPVLGHRLPVRADARLCGKRGRKRRGVPL